MRPDSRALERGMVICSWPITSAKIEGRYFLYNASDIVAPLLYVRSRGSPAHPLERTYPCCLPALGEFGTVMPHGGSAANHSWSHRYPSLSWRIRIAAECARLESVYRETYRGFKSLILRSMRKIPNRNGSSLKWSRF